MSKRFDVLIVGGWRGGLSSGPSRRPAGHECSPRGRQFYIRGTRAGRRSPQTVPEAAAQSLCSCAATEDG